jgi:hypothetical protein
MAMQFQDIDHRLFSLKEYGEYNDVNDIHKDLLEMLPDFIREKARGNSAIDSVFDDLEKQIRKIKKDGML